MLGLWISGQDFDHNEKEIAALPALLEKHHAVIEYVAAGNECLFIQRIKVDKMVEYISRVKALVQPKYDIPVGYGEWVPWWRC